MLLNHKGTKGTKGFTNSVDIVSILCMDNSATETAAVPVNREMRFWLRFLAVENALIGAVFAVAAVVYSNWLFVYVVGMCVYYLWSSFSMSRQSTLRHVHLVSLNAAGIVIGFMLAATGFIIVVAWAIGSTIDLRAPSTMLFIFLWGTPVLRLVWLIQRARDSTDTLYIREK